MKRFSDLDALSDSNFRLHYLKQSLKESRWTALESDYANIDAPAEAPSGEPSFLAIILVCVGVGLLIRHINDFYHGQTVYKWEGEGWRNP
jgi:hypothetical protein